MCVLEFPLIFIVYVTVYVYAKTANFILCCFFWVVLVFLRFQVKCSLSGHEMPCQVEAIQNYIKGKKFQKLLAQNQYNYEKFKEHIVPSTKKGREYVKKNVTFYKI